MQPPLREAFLFVASEQKMTVFEVPVTCRFSVMSGKRALGDLISSVIIKRRTMNNILQIAGTDGTVMVLVF